MKEIIWEEEKAKVTNIGSLRVSYMRNGDFLYVDVSDYEDAIRIINTQSQADLVSNIVVMNGFDLEVFQEIEDAPDWYTWYDESGYDISEMINEMEGN